MKVSEDKYKLLDLAVKSFIETFLHSDPKLKIYDKWNIREILIHISFWHSYYARTLTSLSKGEKPKLYFGRYKDISEIGRKKFAKFSNEELIKKLRSTQKTLEKLFRERYYEKIPYRGDSKKFPIKTYSTLEFIEAVTSHINHHTSDLKKAAKKQKSR